MSKRNRPSSVHRNGVPTSTRVAVAPSQERFVTCASMLNVGLTTAERVGQRRHEGVVGIRCRLDASTRSPSELGSNSGCTTYPTTPRGCSVAITVVSTTCRPLARTRSDVLVDESRIPVELGFGERGDSLAHESGAPRSATPGRSVTSPRPMTFRAAVVARSQRTRHRSLERQRARRRSFRSRPSAVPGEWPSHPDRPRVLGDPIVRSGLSLSGCEPRVDGRIVPDPSATSMSTPLPIHEALRRRGHCNCVPVRWSSVNGHRTSERSALAVATWTWHTGSRDIRLPGR
jgi:hypothetical protein